MVPKPPRHSLERGAEAPRAAVNVSARAAGSDDDSAEEVRLLLADVHAVPMLPKSPLPRDDKSIEFAKTNVN